MSNEAEYQEANLLHWDEAVAIHAASQMYDIEGFKAGRNALYALEQAELGDVRGKTMLHLQCHFGLDTLSWARLGAKVTGVDFSGAAIDKAREIAGECGMEARFIQSTVYDLPDVLDETFDIVFTSYGVLGWLPDIKRWAQVVARYVKPGGTFYIAEIHPASQTLDDAPGVSDLRLRYGYFDDAPVYVDERDGTYADSNANLQHRLTYNYQHSLGIIVTSLIEAGLRIEYLHEWPFTVYPALPGATKQHDGY